MESFSGFDFVGGGPLSTFDPGNPVGDGSFKPVEGQDVFARLLESDSPQFCNKENVLSCLDYLNQELIGQGMSCLFRDPRDFELPLLVNRAYELLQRMRHSVAQRDSLEESKHKALCEVEQLRMEKKKLKTKLESKERELISFKNKADTLSKEITEKEIKARTEKDEVRRLRATLASREKQFMAALKKQEREMCRLRGILPGLMSEGRERGTGLKMSSNLQRADDSSHKWSVTGTFKDKTSLNEDKLSALQKENGSLRGDLQHLYGQLLSINAEYSEKNELLSFPNQNCKLPVAHTFDLKPSLYPGDSVASCLFNRRSVTAQIREELSKIQRKFERPHLIVKRQVLKERNNFLSSRQTVCRTASATNKASSLTSSNLRPKSAVPSKDEKMQHRSVWSATNGGHRTSRPSTVNEHSRSKQVDKITPVLQEASCGNHDNDSSEETRPGMLIRFQSYTVIPDQPLDEVVDTDVDRSHKSSLDCLSLNSSFSSENCRRGNSNEDSDDDDGFL